LHVENRDDIAAGDPLLAPFLAAGSEEAARAILSDLLARAAAPIVRDVVRGHVAGRDVDGAVDGEDIEHTVLLRLTQQLWRLRGGHDEPIAPIANLAAYVTRATSNACYERLRARRPRRARLQARLRYVFRHHPTLAMWERGDGGWACGERGWRDRERVLAWADVAGFRGRIAVPAGQTNDAARLVRLAETIVGTLAAPARVEDVVTLAADALGIVDDPVEPSMTASGEFILPQAPSGLAAGGPATDDRLDQQRFLERVWGEIRTLPVRQRVALLLNLAGPSSQDMLSLLPVTGVASWPDIAAALDMAPERLQALAPGLPHDDHAIAGLLRVTRRQVINLRKCARERLARRLGFAREGKRR
jgi:DNA-directed RNA polymerase specialized sigma24 family protein